MSVFKLDGVRAWTLKTAERLRERAADPELIEAFVRVEGLDTVPENMRSTKSPSSATRTPSASPPPPSGVTPSSV
jgi:hypothetical protein